MARLDLEDLGARVRHVSPTEVAIDLGEAVAAIERLRAAVEGLHAAWLALPPGIRREYRFTLELGEPSCST